MFKLFKKKYENITSEEARKRLNDKDTLIIDVREEYEFKNGHIKNAKHIPLGTLSNKLDNIDKNKKIIVICASGGRSKRAAAILGNKGYNVSNVIGGMMAWSGTIIK